MNAVVMPAMQSAQSLLLDPWGLSNRDFDRAIGEIMLHQVDYADLYFQYTRSEGWSLEEGIVKTGSFSISQGVGVRAVSGEKTAFAYSDALSSDALMSSARAVREIARVGQSRRAPPIQALPAHALYSGIDPVASLPAQEKVALLERIERMARQRDPHVVQVMAGLGMEYDVVLVVGSDGRQCADVRPLVRLSLTVIAQKDGRRETGNAGGGARMGLDYFSNPLFVTISQQVAVIHVCAQGIKPCRPPSNHQCEWWACQRRQARFGLPCRKCQHHYQVADHDQPSKPL